LASADREHVGAELGTQRQGPFDITLESVAEPQLDGAVTTGDLLAGLPRVRRR
jgi:hypothetical protein